jgi:hypothetical protein
MPTCRMECYCAQSPFQPTWWQLSFDLVSPCMLGLVPICCNCVERRWYPLWLSLACFCVGFDEPP